MIYRKFFAYGLIDIFSIKHDFSQVSFVFKFVKKRKKSITVLFLLHKRITMINILKEFFYLLNSGIVKKDYKKYSFDTVKKSILLLVVLFLFSLFAIIVSFFFFYYFNITKPTNLLTLSLKNKDVVYKVILLCVLSPTFEELLHRLGLKFSVINISIVITLLVYYISCYFTKSSMYEVEDHLIFNIAFALFSGGAVFIGLTLFHNQKNKLLLFWTMKPRLIFYISVLFFALPHLSNFNYILNLKMLYYIPFLLLPQIITGVFFGYVRLKYNIFFSILFHSIYNLILLIVSTWTK